MFSRKPTIQLVALNIIMHLVISIFRFHDLLHQSTSSFPPDSQAFLQFTNLLNTHNETSRSTISMSGDKSIIIPWIISSIVPDNLSGPKIYLIFNYLVFIVPTILVSFQILNSKTNYYSLIIWNSLMIAMPNWSYSFLYFYEGPQIFFFCLSIYCLLIENKLSSYFFGIFLAITFVIKWQSFVVFIMPILAYCYLLKIRHLNSHAKIKNSISFALSTLLTLTLLQIKIDWIYNFKSSIYLMKQKSSSIWQFGNNGSEYEVKWLIPRRLISFLNSFYWYHWLIIPSALIVILIGSQFSNHKLFFIEIESIPFFLFVNGMLAQQLLISWDPRYVVIPAFIFFFICANFVKLVPNEN